MVNNTVNGKKIGKAAGMDDKTKIGYISTRQGENEKNLKVDNSTIIPFKIENVRETAEYVAVKAYPGGNPNKEKDNKEGMSHE